MESPASATASDDAERSAVQVAVRVRPLSAGERAQGSEPCVSVVGDASVLVGGLSGKQFDVDAAFAPDAPQRRVFGALVAPLVDRFFDGYNATVFAYGQTGSGKTFTMGNEFTLSAARDDRGVIPRAMDEIFTRIASAPPTVNYVLKVSYLEILNEEIHDLLATTPQAPLSVRDDGKRGICVNGLSEHAVESIEQVATLLHTGALSRATASTNMNAQSSRSHAICTLTMEQYETSVEHGAESKFSKFHLVDLAGSERAKRTNAAGARFKEGVNINKGLLSLGNVINALAEKSTHVPYRDSKLTRLLQDSLGGNSKTLMIACISPADVNFEETCNTLRYASRARNIQNQAVVNQTVSVENQVTYLKQQLEVMQLQLLQQQQGKTPLPSATAATSAVSSFEIDILEKEITRWKTIAKTREEELELVMSAKDKWKKIADEFANKKQRGALTGASRVHSATGDCHSPKSKAMLQDAIEFEKTVQVTQFPSTPAKQAEKAAGSGDDSGSSTSWENDVESLEDVIKEKEKIVQALHAANSVGPASSDEHGPLTALSKGYERKIRELEQQVTKLVEEKQRVAREVNGKGGTGAGESPHSRLQAQLQLVQNQLQVARQAEKECKRLSLLWKNGSLKISTLEKEIVDMKKQKTTLQRQLKDESEAHRKETREQNLKIIQLKRQEQRKQYELQKLTTLHAKQNNVLKRKNEEIASVNKRMRSLVQTQQSAQQMRMQSAKNRVSATGNRPTTYNSTPDKPSDAADADAMIGISQALKETLNVQMTIAGAKAAIQMELEDRKKMALEISRLENVQNDETASTKLVELKAALKVKNADIRLLQQKLASVEKNNGLPNALLPSKISLCHQLIRQLMDTVYESKTATFELESCKNDLEAAEEQLCEQSQRHEETVAAYKKQLHKLGHFDDVEVVSAPANTELEKLRAELKEVRAQLEQAQKVPPSVVLSSPVAGHVKPKKAPIKKKPTEPVDLVDIMSSSEDEVEEDDDSDYVEDDDADGKRAKPKKVGGSKFGASSVGKARQPLKPRADEPKATSAMDEINQLLSKPSVVGGTICCSCNGKCATKSCACRAEKQSCGPDCSCKESKCHNRGDTSKAMAKKSRSDPLREDKENEVESFFDMTDKENLQPLPVSHNAMSVDKGSVKPATTTKLMKLWSGNSSNGLSSSKMSGVGISSGSFSSGSHNASAIARFF